jgi:hypothetical protein
MTYDYKEMALALFTRIFDALKRVQDEALTGVIANEGTPEALDDWQKSEIAQVAYTLTCSIIGGAWATMDEWGTGSKMDPLNPALDEYVGSELWNEYRPGHAIRTRKAGPYKNIFGETEVSEATRPGVDLEALARRYPERDFKMRVIEPSHALQNEMNYMKAGRFQEVMMEVVKDFPWGSFIRVEGGESAWKGRVI